MSGTGHAALDPAQRMHVSLHSIGRDAPFTRHTHISHQVLWTRDGVLAVSTESADWILPPTRALWIPAGLAHETASSSVMATTRSVHLRPHASHPAWSLPTPISARPLLAEIIDYLGESGLAADRRARAEDVLIDLIEPIPLTGITLRMPTSAPARRVAAALRRAPADRRTLEEWGRAVGASGRTVARAFAAETGVSFGRWRTLARLRAALPALAEGVAVGRVAARVGYESASAFVAAFHRETGTTPAAYFRARAGE